MGDRREGDRRRQVDPTTCEKEYSDEEREFMIAIEEYKRRFNRPFPTWTEVLEVIRALGYAKLDADDLSDEQPEPEAVSVEPVAEPT